MTVVSVGSASDRIVGISRHCRVAAPNSHVCGRNAACAQALELCTEVGQAHSRWRCTARGSPTPADLQRLYPTLTSVVGRATPAPGPLQALERLWSARRLCAGVGVMYGGWTSALALEVHGPRFSNACTDLNVCTHLTAVVRARDSARPGSGIELSRLWPARRLCAGVGVKHGGWTSAQPLEVHGRGSPTRVPISNVCTQVSRLWSGTGLPRPKPRPARSSRIPRP